MTISGIDFLSSKYYDLLLLYWPIREWRNESKVKYTNQSSVFLGVSYRLKRLNALDRRKKSVKANPLVIIFPLNELMSGEFRSNASHRL